MATVKQVVRVECSLDELKNQLTKKQLVTARILWAQRIKDNKNDEDFIYKIILEVIENG